MIVLSSELPVFEHHKLWYLQTLCWLPGERSLPIGLLVYLILFILAGNKDNHKSLDVFWFQAESTSDSGVNCPWVSEKICIDVHWKICCDHTSAFILNGSSSFLQVTRTTIKAWMSFSFGHTRPATIELAAHEHLKYSCIRFWPL